MKHVYEAECAFAGIDARQVERISRRLSAAGRDAAALGLTIFGGSGHGTLRIHDDPKKGALIVAEIAGRFDGGDGGYGPSQDGLNRGEV